MYRQDTYIHTYIYKFILFKYNLSLTIIKLIIKLWKFELVFCSSISIRKEHCDHQNNRQPDNDSYKRVYKYSRKEDEI